MSTITFDTLKFVTRLKESGLSDQQAVAGFLQTALIAALTAGDDGAPGRPGGRGS